MSTSAEATFSCFLQLHMRRTIIHLTLWSICSLLKVLGGLEDNHLYNQCAPWGCTVRLQKMSDRYK